MSTDQNFHNESYSLIKKKLCMWDERFCVINNFCATAGHHPSSYYFQDKKTGKMYTGLKILDFNSVEKLNIDRCVTFCIFLCWFKNYFNKTFSPA